MSKPVEQATSATILFAGDSGDGMQLTGNQFTNTSALAGNDLATLPDFPAEIRAPAGTRAGVSGFQLQFSSQDIFTPGDEADVLVAMNPAALVASVHRLRDQGIVIINTDKFGERDLAKADLEENPLEDNTLDGFRVIEVQLSSLTKGAVDGLGLGAKEVDRCKNFFALGMTYWMFGRDPEFTENWIKGKFKDPYQAANIAALQAGINYADTVELFESSYEVPPAKLEPGTYRNINGNAALAMGMAAAAQLAKTKLFYGSYPITPASDVLHSLAKYKSYGVTTFQAEDEIAAVCSAIGASWAGAIGVTGTSGPGLALKGEALGLAMITELPLIIINVQRGGPSTGLPTKTEQSDLLMSQFGRNGESPMVILAACTPSDCFNTAIEAVRISLEYMVPVLLLTDGYIANGSEPWRLPEVDSLLPISNRKISENNNPGGNFLPYKRDPETLARPWAVPGTPGVEHRIGGLEKEEGTGNVSYDPQNHEYMCKMRAEKVARIANNLPEQEVFGPESGTLVLGWGSTYGSIRQAVRKAQSEGLDVAHAHLRHLNPFPKNLGEILSRYDKVIIPEINLGQLVKLVRMEYLIDAVSVPKIQGLPFKVQEIVDAIRQNTETQA
ncbi:MAG: 2-oxoacid:acceptor oxidoreductase subunit alpha [Myxococcota bacterium]|nr:2-oxoacid:acceptor oxidoreductase subunit alpha [Myxococcota bacterium]